MFKVNTDEEFFYRFRALKNQIHNLAALFQNEGTVVSAEELGEWREFTQKAKKELDNLIKEGNKRVEMVEE